jgi:hypothetical protein
VANRRRRYRDSASFVSSTADSRAGLVVVRRLRAAQSVRRRLVVKCVWRRLVVKSAPLLNMVEVVSDLCCHMPHACHYKRHDLFEAIPDH